MATINGCDGLTVHCSMNAGAPSRISCAIPRHPPGSSRGVINGLRLAAVLTC